MLKVLTDLKNVPALVKADISESDQALVNELLESDLIKQIKVPAGTEEVYYVKNPMLEEYQRLFKAKEKLNPESSNKTTPEQKVANSAEEKKEASSADEAA